MASARRASASPTRARGATTCWLSRWRIPTSRYSSTIAAPTARRSKVLRVVSIRRLPWCSAPASAASCCAATPTFRRRSTSTLRKTITVERGQKLLYPMTRFFFYITNRRDLTAAEVVAHANKRCNQENLNAQLKGGVRALRAPVDTLVSNWAYMVMTSLAWSMKAWFALLLPTSGRWHDRYHEEKGQLLRMEFRTFLNALIRIPTQIVRTGRKIIFRLMAYNRWLPALFRGVEGLRALRC
jgi:hypothetical protein